MNATAQESLLTIIRHRTVYISRSKFISKSPLIQRIRDLMRSLRMSPSTESAYVRHIGNFLFANRDRHPSKVGVLEVEDYLHNLATTDHTAFSTQNQARRALELFLEMKTAPRIKRNILTKSEIKSILSTLPEKYHPALNPCVRLKDASRFFKGHRNSLILAIRLHSQKHTGHPMSFAGLKRSLLLQELINGEAWEKVSAKYGPQKVKMACAEFVRCFPNALADNLAC